MLFIKPYIPTFSRLMNALSADYKTFISPFLLLNNTPSRSEHLINKQTDGRLRPHMTGNIRSKERLLSIFIRTFVKSMLSLSRLFPTLNKAGFTIRQATEHPLYSRSFYVFSIQVIEELGGKKVLSISETMLFIYRLPRKFLIISSIVCTLIIAFLVWKTTRPKYVCTNSMGPVVVDSWLDRGYKIIGKYKLLNPRPHPLTESDWLFIHKQLPAWMRKHYPNYRHTPTISQLSIDSLKSNTSYQFTLLHDGKLLEEDVYLLSLPSSNVDQPLKIYIPKASVADEKQLTKDGRLVSKPVLVYP